ncbi:FKBP-type peptidyl-prolyl cis-trans isomerase [Streptomyces sp. NPDC050315]|uniref:FKBP-type peptidyl-prolyl cis-trans isomerase n=1 Tax=Streptomyces sp. NPDC050315 TaxID=3155039 RepID=UPI00343BF27E
MKLTKNTRRAAAAAIAVPVLLFTAACGSDEGSDASIASVEGKAGEQPKIKVDKKAKAPDKAVVKTLSEGKGAAVKKGDFVRLDFVGQMTKGQSLGSSWAKQPGASAKAPRMQAVGTAGQATPQLPTKVMEAVTGKKVGSRFEIEGTAKALIGDQLNPQAGVKPSDGLVWVVDVVAAKKADKNGEVKGEQAAPEAGMPEVKSPSRKPAEITVPKGEKAPKETKSQVLIKGDGPKVKAGEGLIAQYTGVKWEDGKMFDSSWKHGGATAFQIGTNAVVKGWDKALVGKNVGDRVEIVVPPKDGYGTNPQGGELANHTLVFSVDILDTF